MTDGKPKVRSSTAELRNSLGVPYVRVKRGSYELRPPLRYAPGGEQAKARPVTARAPVGPGDAAWIAATQEERKALSMPAGLRALAEAWASQSRVLERHEQEVTARSLPEATFDQAFESYLAAATIKDKAERRKLYERHVQPSLGRRRIADCASARDVQAVVDAPLAAGLSETTAMHIYHCMTVVFDHAFRHDQIPSTDFLKKVLAPQGKRKKDRRRRTWCTQEEITALVRDDRVPLWFRTLVTVTLHVGGLRASDAHAMRWEYFDDGFLTVFVERPKTGDDDQDESSRLDVPEGVRKYLRELHLAEGRPAQGFVFGRRRARRKGQGGKGEKKERGVGYARRLRHWLKEIGVTRYELHHDTATTRRVDWHSFRRMYCTDLADKDVNMQKAMDMAGHKDPRTHRRYVKLSQSRRKSLGLAPDQLSDLAKSG